MRRGGSDDLSSSDDVEEQLLADPFGEDAKPDPVLLKEGTAGIPGSVFNVCNNILGAGVLTMPFAFKRASTIPALLILTIMGIMCSYSFLLLCRCARFAKLYSYKDLSISCFGKRAGIFCEVIVCLMTLGSCISYNILIGDFLPEVAKFFSPHDCWCFDRKIVIVACAVVVLLPLCCLKKLDSLRYSSFLGCLCIVFSSGVICALAFNNSEAGGKRKSAEIFKIDQGLFVAVALMSVAFTMHYNALQYYSELKDRSEARAATVIRTSFSICWVMYALVGAAGYYTFGKAVKGDILKNYDSSYGALVESSRLSLSACILVTFPLPFHACRGAILKIFWDGAVSNLKFYVVTAVMITLSVGIALVSEDVSVVLAYKGSLFGTPIIFIMPSLFYLKLFSPDKRWCTKENVGPMVLLVAGIAFGLLGAVMTTLDVANPADEIPDEDWEP